MLLGICMSTGKLLKVFPDLCWQLWMGGGGRPSEEKQRTDFLLNSCMSPFLVSEHVLIGFCDPGWKTSE